MNVAKYFYRAGLQSRVKWNGQGIKNCCGYVRERFVADFLRTSYISLNPYLTTNFFSSMCVDRLENAFVTL